MNRIVINSSIKQGYESTIMRTILALGIILISSGCATSRYLDSAQLDIVQDVELERYTGTWYEIARLPNSFERNLVGITATYTLREDGNIAVLNQGYAGSFEGRLSQVKGVAWIPDPSQPGRLKVSFFAFFGADYFILELDRQDYQYALVGSSTDDFLWILSRTPKMQPDLYEMLVKKARERGYDTDQLIVVEQ